ATHAIQGAPFISPTYSSPYWDWVDLAFSPNGMYLSARPGLATMSVATGPAVAWEVTSRNLLPSVGTVGEKATYVAFSPDNQLAAIPIRGTSQHTIQLWSLSTGKMTASLSGNSADAENVTFSPDGRMLASLDDSGTIALWDVSGRKVSTGFRV